MKTGFIHPRARLWPFGVGRRDGDCRRDFFTEDFDTYPLGATDPAVWLPIGHDLAAGGASYITTVADVVAGATGSDPQRLRWRVTGNNGGGGVIPAFLHYLTPGHRSNSGVLLRGVHWDLQHLEFGAVVKSNATDNRIVSERIYQFGYRRSSDLLNMFAETTSQIESVALPGGSKDKINLRLENPTHLHYRARVWLFGTAEPSSWDIDYQVPDQAQHPAAGYAGLYLRSTINNLTMYVERFDTYTVC
jgi:hypothetical protein